MTLLQLVKKALLLLNMVLMLLLNMAGNGIAADTKKGITSAKDSAEVYNPRFCLARTVFVCPGVIIILQINYILFVLPWDLRAFSFWTSADFIEDSTVVHT